MVLMNKVTPAMAAVTSGLVGDCVDCHTMHNSEQGQPVAKVGFSTTASATPIQNLLRMDCIACHADPTATSKIVDMGGGSAVPQVNHADRGNDLAGGNFSWITAGADNRRGHNVVDVVAHDDNGTGLNNLVAPPGMYLGTSTHGSANRFTMDNGFLSNFTCAGSAGCHGIRNRATATLNANDTTNDAGNTIGAGGAPYYEDPVRLTGIAAISGAHHNSYDGLKDPGLTTPTGMGGQYIADSYRFIPGLKGLGNTTSDADRWANVSSASHNEYAGNTDSVTPDSHGIMGTCGNCHISGTAPVYENEHLYVGGYLQVPNQDISGFCVTCHGMFHSTGTSVDPAAGGNGNSGAFLRHPADYTIPSTGEYSAYTSYEITAPVARPVADLALMTGPSATVTPGTDMVMCLSCHVAHASEYDGMLRFNYELMQAGNAAGADLGTGCLACHTSKGILPQNR
jgi:hypothetical protein